MNIYIYIELKKRELSPRLLLALDAAKRGHDVYLGDILPYFNRSLFKPGIIHHKFTPTVNRIRQLKEFKNKSFGAHPKMKSQDIRTITQRVY